jgi:hypothetical protein
MGNRLKKVAIAAHEVVIAAHEVVIAAREVVIAARWNRYRSII